MPTRRIRVRAPGVKPGSKIGPLGPFRGTLGLHWIVGSLAVGAVILLAVGWFLLRPPGAPFRPVGRIEEFPPGTGREVLAGVFVGRTTDGRPFAVAEPPGCPLRVEGSKYVDCSSRRYGMDGRSLAGAASLPRLPLQVHRGDVYVSPSPVP